MIGRKKPFPGGYRFACFEGQPEAALIDLESPERALIPLRQGFRDEADPVVNAGDAVTVGQVVGRNDAGVCSPVHASVTGVVEEVRATDPEDDTAGCVVIRAGNPTPWIPLTGHSPEWAALPVTTLEALLYESGVTALGGGIPTRHRTAVIEPDEVEAIIVHDTGSEMYGPSLSVLLGGDELKKFVEGLRILQNVMRGAPVHAAIDSRETTLIETLTEATAALDGVQIHSLAPRYPQDFDELLVPALLGRPFPHGYAAANIGVVTLDVQAVIHARDAVVEGKPLIERIVALCGPGFERPGHVRLPVGIPLGEVARQAGAEAGTVRLVKNSSLTGQKLADPMHPVDRTFSALVALPEHRDEGFLPFVRPGFAEDAYSRTFLACLLPTKRKASTNLKGEERPCVSCGYCQDACPTGIIPHLLYKYVSRGYLDDILVDELRIFDCIGCNLCSYVCPSKIGVGRHIRTGQAMLLKEGLDNTANVLPRFELKGLDSDEPTP